MSARGGLPSLRVLGAALTAALVWMGASAPVRAQAAGPVPLDRGSVVVFDRSDDEADRAMTEVLRQIILRRTGNPRADLAVPDVMADPAAYAEVRFDSGLPPDTPLPEGARKSIAHVTIDTDRLDRALRDQGLRLWEGARPEILVLLRWDVRNSAHLVTDESTIGAPYRDLVQQAADRLALPIRFLPSDVRLNPILVPGVGEPGQTDRSGFWPLRELNQRVGTDAVLAISIVTFITGEWRGHWALITDDGTTFTEADTESVDDLLSRAIEDTASRLSGTESGNIGPPDTIPL